MTRPDQAVIKLSHDDSFDNISVFKINKLDFSWLTSDSSKWPVHEIEYHNDESNLIKGYVKFIGTEPEANEFFDSCKIVENRFVSIPPSLELIEIKAELEHTKSRLTDTEKKLSDFIIEFNNTKKIFCPVDPKTFTNVGRHGNMVTRSQIKSAILESTDLKGICVLVFQILGFTTEQRHDQGKTCISKLDEVEQQKVEDLIDFFVEEKKTHEEKHPKIEKAKRKLPKQVESSYVAIINSVSGSNEPPNALDGSVQVVGTSEVVAKPKRKREEPIDESTLEVTLRKKALKDKFSKKLGNKTIPKNTIGKKQRLNSEA